LLSSIKDKKRDTHVAKVNGRLIGFLDLCFIPDFVHGGKIALIQNLVVAEEYRGLGIGDKLVGRAVKRAEERKALELHAWTEFENKPAIGLYKKHGLTKEHLLLERGFHGK